KCDFGRTKFIVLCDWHLIVLVVPMIHECKKQLARCCDPHSTCRFHWIFPMRQREGRRTPTPKAQPANEEIHVTQPTRCLHTNSAKYRVGTTWENDRPGTLLSPTGSKVRSDTTPITRPVVSIKGPPLYPRAVEILI